MLQILNVTVQIGVVSSEPRFFMAKRRDQTKEIERYNFLLCIRDVWNDKKKVYLYVNSYGTLARNCNDTLGIKAGDLVIVKGHIGSYLKSYMSETRANKFTHKPVIMADVIMPINTNADYDEKIQRIWVEKEQALKKIEELEFQVDKLRKQVYGIGEDN